MSTSTARQQGSVEATVFSCCRNNFLQTQQFKITLIYYYSSGGQKFSGPCWFPCSKSPKATVKVSPGHSSGAGSTLGLPRAVGRLQLCGVVGMKSLFPCWLLARVDLSLQGPRPYPCTARVIGTPSSGSSRPSDPWPLPPYLWPLPLLPMASPPLPMASPLPPLPPHPSGPSLFLSHSQGQVIRLHPHPQYPR